MGRLPLSLCVFYCLSVSDFFLSVLSLAKPKPHYLLLCGCLSLFDNALSLVQRGFIDSGSWLPPAIVAL